MAVAYILVVEKNMNGLFNPIVHIGQAEVLFDEYMTGDYDTHFWLSLGHLALVENHFYNSSGKEQKNAIELADYIRKERIKAIKDFSYRPYFLGIVEYIKEKGFDINTWSMKSKDYLILGNVSEALEESISGFPKIYNLLKNKIENIVRKEEKWEDFPFLKVIEMATIEEEKQYANKRTRKKNQR